MIHRCTYISMGFFMIRLITISNLLILLGLTSCGQTNCDPSEGCDNTVPDPLACTENFLAIPDNVRPSRGCVVRTFQQVENPQTRQYYGVREFVRRYILYIPETVTSTVSVPVVFVYHGANVNAETVAYYDTNNRFEDLADRDNFVVVYPQGLPPPRGAGPANNPRFESPGYFQSCNEAHEGEHLDVLFVRQILEELANNRGLSINRDKVFATGISAGGGVAFMFAIEAPDLIKAVAPVVPLPFHINMQTQLCSVSPNVGQTSIIMLASTADPLISYEEDPTNFFLTPSMETTRDEWLNTMGIANTPIVTTLPSTVLDDSHAPHSGITDSFVELYEYPEGPSGQQLKYYKVVGGGHTWPHESQISSNSWNFLGKRNQDINFVDEAWNFFSSLE